MNTTQNTFNPMRGDMFDGCTINCDNGDTLTLHSVMRGWELRHNGKPIAAPSASAYEITALIINHGL